MTRRVEERDLTTILQLHIVGTDVLGDTTGLTGNHVGIADKVEQRGFTMVYMTHHRHYRGAVYEIVLIVLLLSDGILHLGTDILGSESELFGDDIDGLGIQALVDAHHDADAHTGTDDLIDTHVHHRSKLADGHELGQLEHLALCCLRLHLLLHALGDGITLLATVLGTLLVLILRSQTGQRLLHLTGNGLIVYLKGFHGTVFLILVLAALLTTLILVVLVATLILLFLVLIGIILTGCSLNVHLARTDTLTLLLLTIGTAVHLSLLLLTLLTALLLGFLLRASALVQCIEVDLTYHVEIGSSNLLLSLQLIDFHCLLLGLGSRFFGLGCCLYNSFGLRLHFGFGLSNGSLGLYLLCLFGLLDLLNLLSLLSCLHLLHFHFFHHLHLRLGSSLRGRCLYRLRLCRFLRYRLLANILQVNLTQRLELLTVFFALRLHLHLGLWFLLLGFLLLLGEDHVGLVLYVLVTLELLDERLVLLIGDLGIDIGIVLDLTKALLVLQIIYCRLKTNVQFR